MNEINELTAKIEKHPVYFAINSIDALKTFMEQHVFAVWDFMCLLKGLYSRLVTVDSLWQPPRDAMSAHLIGNILADEEGDIGPDGKTYHSHFALYLQAMREIGADTTPIEKLLQLIGSGMSVENALNKISIDEKTKSFVLTTLEFTDRSTHELAAAFVYGRENITDLMFTGILHKIKGAHFVQSDSEVKLDTIVYYLERHIELDSEDHFPKALQMLKNMTAGDPSKEQEANTAAEEALTSRLNLLDGLLDKIQGQARSCAA